MSDCIFCKIARSEIKADVVFQNDDVVAFRDVDPQAPVHFLVVPRKHIERLSAASDSDGALLSAIHRAIRDIVRQENLADDGYRVVVNEGTNGGQTVWHIHFHVLAGRPLSWPPG